MLFLTILAAALPALCSAAITLLIGPQRVVRASRPLATIAAGLLLTLAFTHLLPEAVHEGDDPHAIGLTALCAVLLLAFVEMLCTGRNLPFGHHHHVSPAPVPAAAAGAGISILSGTALHTFCDGVMIASAFMLDAGVGFAVTLAVMAHEMPQQLGDYAVLAEFGLSKEKAFCVMLAAFVGMQCGAVLSHFVLNAAQNLIPYALAVAAASFIYVSLCDLLPRLIRRKDKAGPLNSLLFLMLGVLIAILASHFHAH